MWNSRSERQVMVILGLWRLLDGEHESDLIFSELLELIGIHSNEPTIRRSLYYIRSLYSESKLFHSIKNGAIKIVDRHTVQQIGCMFDPSFVNSENMDSEAVEMFGAMPYKKKPDNTSNVDMKKMLAMEIAISQNLHRVQSVILDSNKISDRMEDFSDAIDKIHEMQSSEYRSLREKLNIRNTELTKVIDEERKRADSRQQRQSEINSRLSASLAELIEKSLTYSLVGIALVASSVLISIATMVLN